MSSRFPPSGRYNPRQQSYPAGNRYDERWDRDRRPDTRPHSPGRRDSREYAHGLRDIDVDRAQRHPRDAGPGSAGSGNPEHPRFGNQPFRGSSYSGRGRGRDWDNRGRRSYPQDERDHHQFRPRSRSRGRIERDRSVDSRDYDRRDERREERRDERRDDYRRDDDWHYRRPRPDEREYLRRDPPPRSDTRHTEAPISPAERSRGVSPHRRTSPDLVRRQSTVTDLLPPSVARRDSERPDTNTLRSDATRERNVTRQSEPDTHLSVAVPQFGSIPTIPSSTSAVATKPPTTPVAPAPKTPIIAKISPTSATNAQSNAPIEKIKPPTTVSQASKEIVTVADPVSQQNEKIGSPQIPPPTKSPTPSIVQQIPQINSIPEPVTENTSARPPPVAPRAQLQSLNAPTAPKADRINEQERKLSGGHEPMATQQDRKEYITTASRPINAPTLSSTKSDVTEFVPHRNIPVGSPVIPQRLAPPTGPRASSGQPFPRAASAGPFGRDVSPTQPQSSIAPSANPVDRGLPMNVPTGPKAHRLQPNATRMQKVGPNRLATSIQWRAPVPGPAPGRPTMIPAKRDANGEEKERTPVPERSAEPFSRASTYSVEPRYEQSQGDHNSFAAQKPRSVSDTSHRDVQMVDHHDDPESFAFDTDDDGMELDEEDFQLQEARYKEKKAALESQMINLENLWRVRIMPVIEQIDHLVGVLDIVPELPLPQHAPAKPIASISMADPLTKESEIPVATTENPEADVPMQDLHENTPPKSRMGSPDFVYLPYLAQGPPTPSSDPDHGSGVDDGDIKDLLKFELNSVEEQSSSVQGNLRDQYTEQYKSWKKTTLEYEKEKERVEAAIAQTQAEVEIPEPQPEQIAPPLPTPTTERRRQHGYTTELDLQRVLEESRKEEEARREKAEREAKEAQASAEREAEVPQKLALDEIALRNFKDTSLLRHANEALRVFEFAPCEDTFTEEEDQKLRHEYDQGTKMWHKIADAVGRSTKECINHYYATKWEQPYKRHKQKRGKRTKKGQIRKPESELQAQDNVISLNEKGRPRRAAAPVFSSKNDKKTDDSETDPTTSKKSILGKSDVPPGEEKSARGRKPGKEKPGRKPKNPPATTKPVPSPQKLAKEKKEKPLPPMDQDDGLMMPLSRQPIFAPERMVPAMMPQSSMYPEPPLSMLQQHKPELVPPLVPLPPTSLPMPMGERPRSHSQSQRPGPSSYWSVPEEAEFKECLQYYGTDFSAIAAHMGKKTAVMIKNHFQKLRQDENKNADILIATQKADARRDRGEPLGPMPANLRKPAEALISTPSRSIMQSTEMMDMDSPPSGGPLHGSPLYHGHNRLQILQEQQANPVQHGFPPHVMNAQPVQQKQPRLGYFSSEVSPVKTHAQPQSQPHMSPPMSLAPDVPGQSKHVGRIKTEYEPRQPLVPTRREAGSQPTALQAAMQSVVQNAPEPQMTTQRLTDQERLPVGLMDFGSSARANLGPNISVRPLMNENHPQGQQGRSFVDLTSPHSLQKPALDQLGRPLRPQSPSVQSYSPSGLHQPPVSIPPSTQATSRPQSTPSSAPAPPSRKVNIMSMLNPEPAEEERPKKKEPERPPPPPTSHAQHMSPHEQYHGSADPYRDGSRHGHRPMYSASHVPVAVPEGVSNQWAARQPYMHPVSTMQPGHVDSPRMQVQHSGQSPIDTREPRDSRDPRDPRNTRDYRSVTLGGLNQTHGVPSPPPGPYGQSHGHGRAHSRNSSFTQPGAPSSGPPSIPSEAYSSIRGGYPPPHSNPPPPSSRPTPMHPIHSYSNSYGESPVIPGAPIDHRARDMGMRSISGGYRREYDMQAHGRDPRDPQSGHPVYQHSGHASPQPGQDPRYPPPPAPRSTHMHMNQGYSNEPPRGMEAPRGYEAGPPPPSDNRERDHWYQQQQQQRR